MGRVPEAGAVQAVDRREDGGGVGDSLYSDEEIKAAFEARRFGIVHEDENHDLDWRSQIDCINSNKPRTCLGSSFTCPTIREDLDRLRRDALLRREGRAPEMHREVDIVQRVDAQFFNSPVYEGLYSEGRNPIRNGFQHGSTSVPLMDGPIAARGQNVFEQIGPIQLNGKLELGLGDAPPMKEPKPKLKLKQIRVTSKIHNLFARELKELIESVDEDEEYVFPKQFLLGANWRGIVTGAVLIDSDNGGCDASAGHTRQQMTDALLKMIKLKLRPIGQCRVNQEKSGDFQWGSFLNQGEGGFDQIMIDYTSEGVHVIISHTERSLKYLVVK